MWRFSNLIKRTYESGRTILNGYPRRSGRNRDKEKIETKEMRCAYVYVHTCLETCSEIILTVVFARANFFSLILSIYWICTLYFGETKNKDKSFSSVRIFCTLLDLLLQFPSVLRTLHVSRKNVSILIFYFSSTILNFSERKFSKIPWSVNSKNIHLPFLP